MFFFPLHFHNHHLIASQLLISSSTYLRLNWTEFFLIDELSKKWIRSSVFSLYGDYISCLMFRCTESKRQLKSFHHCFLFTFSPYQSNVWLASHQPVYTFWSLTDLLTWCLSAFSNLSATLRALPVRRNTQTDGRDAVCVFKWKPQTEQGSIASGE